MRPVKGKTTTATTKTSKNTGSAASTAQPKINNNAGKSPPTLRSQPRDHESLSRLLASGYLRTVTLQIALVLACAKVTQIVLWDGLSNELIPDQVAL